MDIPPPLADLARQAVGEITSVADRSWPRENSAVWEITTAARRRYFVKRHPAPLFHEREVTAYREIVPVLGRGRTPELIAADRNLAAIVISGLPGEVVRGLSLSPSLELEVYRQAGGLLRRIHGVPITGPGVRGIGRLVQRCEEHLRRAEGLLHAREVAFVRACAATLSTIEPRLPVTATHGDFQPRNFLWERRTCRLALIDFERAEPGPAVRDLVRLEYGTWDDRPELRAAFLDGYGRDLTDDEQRALTCLAGLDALSGLQWGTEHRDTEVTGRARDAFARLMK
ncbi:aminoglycoside phosphotransferase family protein [Actinomadura scrupuli]|uniref:aminoglycoside phosphotransferase family protein n=1 Tax=Actinomadura scrupuli TaxID=559629 RepID=UPI003D99937E